MNKNVYEYCISLSLSLLASQSYGMHIQVLSENELSRFSVVQSNVYHTGTDACIKKVTDGNGLYILKQIKNPSLEEQFLLINDCIASTIGCQAGIHVNKVFFIPFDVGSHLKTYPDRAATLHACVPGIDIDSKFPEHFPADFTMHQRVIHYGSMWQEQYPLAENRQGLRKQVIESMSFHKDLPLIVALDTFVGNGDRSLPNIFYDTKNDCFYGIDQAAAFSAKLAMFAYDRLKEFIAEDYFNNAPEAIMNGLREYREILWKLYQDNNPSRIAASMQELVPFLGLNVLHDNAIVDRVKPHAFIIEHNYAYVLKLIELLDCLIVSKRNN